MVAIEDSSTTEMSRIAAESVTRDPHEKYHTSPERGISGTAASNSFVNLAAAHLPPLLLAQSNKVFRRTRSGTLCTLCRGGARSSLFATAEQHLPANPRSRRQQPHQRQRQHRLPAA